MDMGARSPCLCTQTDLIQLEPTKRAARAPLPKPLPVHPSPALSCLTLTHYLKLFIAPCWCDGQGGGPALDTWALLSGAHPRYLTRFPSVLLLTPHHPDLPL